MAYVYRHIRIDKNEPFYIGIGKDEDGKYIRANRKLQRSKFWNNVAQKGYEIEILMEGLSWEQACQKETEFISLYGRKDLGLGPLVNMTDGGDGFNNPSPETRLKKSASLKNRVFSEDHKNNLSKSKTGKKLSQEHIQKLKDSHIGLTRKIESNIKTSVSLLGNKNGLGYKHTQEALNKISQASKGAPQLVLKCPHCSKIGGVSAMKRWHMNNCKEQQTA